MAEIFPCPVQIIDFLPARCSWQILKTTRVLICTLSTHPMRCGFNHGFEAFDDRESSTSGWSHAQKELDQFRSTLTTWMSVFLQALIRNFQTRPQSLTGLLWLW
jgi:hypothetical protein